MADTLYDREEDGGSCLSEDGACILRQAQFAIQVLLAQVEENGPIDLRDLQLVLHSAVDDVILNEIIHRRLADKPKISELPDCTDYEWNEFGEKLGLLIKETKEDLTELSDELEPDPDEWEIYSGQKLYIHIHV